MPATSKYIYLHCIATERIARVAAVMTAAPPTDTCANTTASSAKLATETTAEKKVAAVGDVHTSIR